MKDVEKINIKFNTLYSMEESSIDYGENCENGQYDIAPYYLAARYSNSAKPYFAPD